MKNNIDPRLEEGNKIFADVERYIAFLDAPFAIRPIQYGKDLVKRISDLESTLEDHEPATIDELYLVELKRRLFGQRQLLEVDLSGRVPNLQDVIQTFFIPQSDLDALEDWLTTNRKDIEQANDRMFKNHTDKRRASTPLGNHKIRAHAESLVQDYIERYLAIMKKVFHNSSQFNNFLKNYQILTDTSTNRSVSNRFSKLILISISATTYIQEGALKINPEVLISSLNHEVVGHGLNYSITDNSNVPEFIKTGSGEITASTRESLAEYIESYLFEELKTHPNITEELKLHEPFERVYQRYTDSRLMDNYWKKLSKFSILTASKLSKNDIPDIVKKITEVSIDSGYPNRFISKIRNDWHPHTNTLLPHIISELKYCANPVSSSIAAENIQSITNEHLFTGFWTPTGYKQWLHLSKFPH